MKTSRLAHLVLARVQVKPLVLQHLRGQVQHQHQEEDVVEHVVQDQEKLPVLLNLGGNYFDEVEIGDYA